MSAPMRSHFRMSHSLDSFVYALRDPDTNEIFYIGLSWDPTTRWMQHIFDRKRGPKQDRIRWLIRMQQLPVLEILECVPENKPAVDRELYWINLGRALGWPLTNREFLSYPNMALAAREKGVKLTRKKRKGVTA